MIRRRLRDARSDSGFTLAEMLVAITLSSIVGAILLGMTLTAQKSVVTTTGQDDLTAEARVALNRISRDLRQATPYTVNGALTPALTAVQNPDGTGHVAGAATSLTFTADFNGDGCIGGVASDPLPGSGPGTVCNPAKPVDPSDPEVVTYCWGGASDQHIYIVSGTVKSGGCVPSSGTSEPLLSGKISDFEFYYRSNTYRFDANGDGITTWHEMDAAGDNNGILDASELRGINSIVLRMTAMSGGHSQSYQTQIDLRDVS